MNNPGRWNILYDGPYRYVYCFQLPEASWQCDSPSGTLGQMGHIDLTVIYHQM